MGLPVNRPGTSALKTAWFSAPQGARRTGYAAGMNTAIVFINTAVDQVGEVAEAVAALPGVTEVYSVTGAIDLIALVRTRSVDEIADVVTGQVNKLQGVVSTQTHLAFRAYSAHDLEAAFSLGD